MALGNIGGRLLKPFVLVMDYPNGRIAFVRRVEGPSDAQERAEPQEQSAGSR